MVRRKLRENDLCVTSDDCQQVIEVMGDSSGELTNGLHFLCLMELILNEFLSSNIPRNTNQPNDFSGVVFVGSLRGMETSLHAINRGCLLKSHTTSLSHDLPVSLHDAFSAFSIEEGRIIFSN